MRSRFAYPVIVLTVLAVLLQVVFGGLGGTVCFRSAHSPAEIGWADDCCEDHQYVGMKVASFASHLDDRPIDSDCCIDIGDQASLQFLPRTGAGKVGFVVQSMAADMGPHSALARPHVTIAIGEASPPPKAIHIIRTTVLLI